MVRVFGRHLKWIEDRKDVLEEFCSDYNNAEKISQSNKLSQEDSTSTNDISKQNLSKTVQIDKQKFQFAAKLHLLTAKKEENNNKLSSQLAIDVKDTVKEEI